MNTILGKKVGMTQIFSETGAAVPVTVIEAGPVVVTQIKTVETDGYEAIQIGYADEKAHRVSQAAQGSLRKGSGSPKKYLQEVRVENASEYQLNQEFTVEIFEAGKSWMLQAFPKVGNTGQHQETRPSQRSYGSRFKA